MNLPWVEKYRPETLEDLVSQNNIIYTINRLIKNNQLPHLLFYGPPGTGKTSTILAIAKQLYSSPTKSNGNNHVHNHNNSSYSHMVLELNASDDRGIVHVRNKIKSFVETSSFFSEQKIKLVILDEADNMTRDAQFALRRIIEKYAKNVRFCLICNYTTKIIPAIQSRCTRFRFSPIKQELIVERIRQIMDKENIKMDDNALNTLLKLGKGDMRKILNTLQSTSLSVKFSEFNEKSPILLENDKQCNIISDDIYACIGKPTDEDIHLILETIQQQSYNESVNMVQSLITNKGYDLSDIITQIATIYSDSEHLISKKINPKNKIQILSKLCEAEFRVSSDINTKLQILGLVSVLSS